MSRLVAKGSVPILRLVSCSTLIKPSSIETLRRTPPTSTAVAPDIKHFKSYRNPFQAPTSQQQQAMSVPKYIPGCPGMGPESHYYRLSRTLNSFGFLVWSLSMVVGEQSKLPTTERSILQIPLQEAKGSTQRPRGKALEQRLSAALHLPFTNS